MANNLSTTLWKPLVCQRILWINILTQKKMSEKQHKMTAVLFAGEMVYKALNPKSKMDVPSMIYERMEEEFDKSLENK